MAGLASPVNLRRRPYGSLADDDPLPPLWRRAFAALAAPRLDAELAAGVDPAGRPVLAARAATLRRRRRRLRLAHGLETAADAAAGPHGRAAQAPVARRDVRLCTHVILDLAERLRRDEAPGVAGVARVELLLTDPLSPLYSPTSSTALRDALDDAAERL
jgi:hypothetical protein